MDEMAQDGWRRGPQYDARPAARYDVPVSAHVGSAGDFVSRLQAVARSAGRPNSTSKKEYFDNLLDWLSDERNLMIALEQQEERGGGPGIDGLRFSDLPPRKQRWPILRDLRDQLRSGSYEPLSLLHQPIPKGEGDGKRPLDIPAIFDRVVGRAVCQAVEPYLDGLFLPFSFGYRRRRDRRHAIAYAGATALHQDRWVWAVLDITNAFGSVPRQRLLQIIRRYIPDENVVKLISLLIDMDSKRGMPQGQPLCPLLFNLCLHHILDLLWPRQHAEIPLARWSDNLLLLCRSWEEAIGASRDLADILRPHGMILGTTPDVSIRDLSTGSTASFLGFEISKERNTLKLDISQRKGWDRLQDKLRRTHTKEDSPIRALGLIEGWLCQMAPAIQEDQVEETVSRVCYMAREQAFEELPTEAELVSVCRKAHEDWQRLSRKQLDSLTSARPAQMGGSAAHEPDFSAADGRCRAAANQDAAPQAAAALATLHCDGCCVDNCIGGWAYVLGDGISEERRVASGAVSATTNNRMELYAAIKGLQQVPPRASVMLITDSTYVADGITLHLPRWRNNDWTTGPPHRRRRVANTDLWMQLSALIECHDVHVAWVAGHSGDVGNELCDRLALDAALRLHSIDNAFLAG